MFPLQK